MKRLLIPATLSAALMTSACVTVIDADDDDFSRHGENAQPFDGARAECRASTGEGQGGGAFRDSMSARDRTRG